jgi:hypothetical protein
VWFVGLDPQALYPRPTLFLKSRKIERLLFCVEGPAPTVLQAVQVMDLSNLRPDQAQEAIFASLIESL